MSNSRCPSKTVRPSSNTPSGRKSYSRSFTISILVIGILLALYGLFLMKTNRKAISLSTSAHNAHIAVADARTRLESLFLYLAQHLTLIHDNELYKRLDHPTFASWLADPEINIPQSTAYRLIKLYKYYVLERKCDQETLARAGQKKLELILPYVKSGADVYEWVNRAGENSVSDVRTALGIANPEMSHRGDKPEPEYTSWSQYVKAQPCLICGATPVDGHHFPITKAAGGNFTIALCRQHHTECHTMGVVTWFDKYRRPLERFLWIAVNRGF